MSAKYKSPSFLLPNELNTSANPLNTDGNPATGTGINSLYSMKFDGSSYISLGDDVPPFNQTTSKFSISLWLYNTVYPNEGLHCIFENRLNYAGGSSNNSGIVFESVYHSGQYGLWFRMYPPNSSPKYVTFPQTELNEDEWNHIAIVFDGTESNYQDRIEIYVNNSPVTLNYPSSNVPTQIAGASAGNEFRLAAGYQPNFIGQMDEFCIFSKSLTSTEVSALYNSGTPAGAATVLNLGASSYYPLGEQAQNSGYPGSTTPANNVWQFPNGVLQDYVMDFDGGNYIDVGENILPSGNFTISAWVKPDSFPIPYATIFSSYENSASGRLLFRIKNDGKLELSLDSATLTSNTSLSANTWQHVMVALSGTSLTFYLNGSIDGSGTASTPPAQNLTTYIGAWNNSGSPNGYFNGEISNLAIWNSDQATNKDNIYNNGSPQTSYTVTPQNWWKLNADSVYTPSVSKYPTSLNFASSSYIISSSSVITGNSDRTVSVWAKTPNYTSKKAIFSLGDTTGSGSTTKFAIRINGTDDIQIASKGYDFLFSNTGIIVTDNNWHHFAATYSYSGSTAYFKLYIDGNYIGEQTGSLQLNTSAGFSIGTWGYGTNRDFFNGDISNAVVYNSELKATQISTLFNFGTPETTPSFSPVAWWKLDDQNAITDYSGNGHTGNNNGATDSPGTVALIPSWKIPSALPITSAANYTTALDFDGGDHVSFPFNVSTIGTNNYSTSFWFNYNAGDLEDYPYLYGFGVSADYQAFGLTGKVGDTYNIRINNNYNNNYTQTISTGNVISAGVWYNVTITRDGNTINCYLNGDPLITLSNSDVSNNNLSASSFKLGWGDFVSNRYFNSKVSNFAIFNTDLSASQVSTLYNGGTPETAISFSPISWWKLDTGGSTITDYGSAGNNGTNNGATQVTSDVLTTQPVNGVSTTLPSTALQQSDLQFDSPYSNYSLKFSTSQRVNTNFTLPASYTSYSYSIWYKQTAAIGSADQYLIGNWPQGGSSADMLGCVRFNGSVNLRFLTGNGTTLYQTTDLNVSTLLLDGNWHHIAITIVSGEIKLYIDASLENTYSNASIVTGISANRDYALGFSGNTAGGGYLTNSLLDEFAIFDKKLTEAEILSIYNNGRPGDISPIAPTNWWRLGENAYFVNNDITLPNSIAGAPNGVSSGTATSMLSADAPGTYANGIGDGLAITDRVGDAPLSVANSQSYNMIPDDKVPYVPGYVGAQTTNVYSMTFDGVDDFIDLESSIDVTGNTSFSYWFKANNTTQFGTVLDINSSSTTNRIWIGLYSGKIWAYTGTGNSVKTTTNYLANTWYHITVIKTSSASISHIYVNGVAETLISDSGTFGVLTTGGRIGNQISYSSYFSGSIDEVAIFDKALTPDQIKFDLYEPTALVGGVEKTADIENNTNLPTPLAWYRMGD